MWTILRQNQIEIRQFVQVKMSPDRVLKTRSEMLGISEKIVLSTSMCSFFRLGY